MTLITAVQMASTKEVQKNIEMACQAIALGASQGAKLIVLPEEFATLGLTGSEKRAIAETFEKGPLQQQLKNAAKENKIWVIGGTLLIKDQQDKPCSSTLVYNSEGECVARYDKIHLFDVFVAKDDAYSASDKYFSAASGVTRGDGWRETKYVSGELYHESENIAGGKKIVVIPTPFGKVGLAICYDLRFPELFRAMMLKGAQIVVLPSAFTRPTGKAHWEILLRARAIENLCYIIAPGECGNRSDGRVTYGHSMIISPWGEILASLKEDPGLISASIDLNKLEELRNNFPALNHIQLFVMQELLNEVKG